MRYSVPLQDREEMYFLQTIPLNLIIFTSCQENKSIRKRVELKDQLITDGCDFIQEHLMK